MHVHWLDGIANRELWEKTGQEPELDQILRRKWNWLGYTLRRNDDQHHQTGVTVDTTRPQTEEEDDQRILGKEIWRKKMWTAGYKCSWRKMEAARGSTR